MSQFYSAAEPSDHDHEPDDHELDDNEPVDYQISNY